jgi:FtsP/CotA-like multicopper oxidase with cupredoxin domain
MSPRGTKRLAQDHFLIGRTTMKTRKSVGRNTQRKFTHNPISAAVMLAIAGTGVSQVANAGPGHVPTGTAGGYTSIDPKVLPNNGLGIWNVSTTRPTYYANSPLGNRIDPVTGLAVNTGTPLRKFVDTLPGLTPAGANKLGQYLPVAVADTASYPGSDYYEMAVVEYKEHVHSDLPATGTTFRGYVQIDRAMTNTSTSTAAYNTYVTEAAAYAAANAGIAAAQPAYTTAWTTYNTAVLADAAAAATYKTQLAAYNAAAAGAAVATSLLEQCAVLTGAAMSCTLLNSPSYPPAAPTYTYLNPVTNLNVTVAYAFAPTPATAASVVTLPVNPGATAPLPTAGTAVAPLPVVPTYTYVDPISTLSVTSAYGVNLVTGTLLLPPNPTPVAPGGAGAAPASPGSLGVALLYPNGTPIMVPKEVGPNAAGVWDHSLAKDALGKLIMVPAYGFDKPHYLGPVIVATGQSTPTAIDNRPVRIKFDNLLPLGRATTAAGVVTRNGDLFLPFDTTLIGAGATPVVGETYMQNRAELHLHGGVTPWISDGTPHQWTVPVGETAASATLQKGVSAQNVPDMPDPGQGAETLYWTNAQSARLMFWHDHTVGQTRLNVYAGMAAGYVLTDATETAFMTATGLGIGTPLVIEDKTFVPADIAQQDSKWRTDAWGQYGDLWYPHVIEANQDPNSLATSYTNPVGRWDYALWFWPVFPVTNALPTGDYGNVTTTPEGLMDTPTVNGTPYPTLTVNPEPTRFRILNAANDRFQNLQLYVADAAQNSTVAGTVPNTEVKMVSALATVGLPNCAISADGYDQLVIPLQPAAGSVPLAGAPLTGPGSCWPTNWPTDGRVGGVPDPSTIGPTMWHIGSEGGFLPAVASEPPVPVNFDYNRRSVTVLNVSQNNDPTQACAAANAGAGACHGLYLGPAERADVVVDFSAYAGRTLILYSDAPAPNPGYDPRIDYFTGDPDNTLNGGAPTTVAGFGPNIRTVMQINVAAAATAKTNATPAAQAAFVTSLGAALKTAYLASQDKPIVAQLAYDKALGTVATPATGDQFARIAYGSTSQLSAQFADGTGVLKNYCVPSVVAAAPPTNIASLQMPAIGSNGIACDGPILNKAIQELFDKYGRMNATLGTELPATAALTQTTMPFGYIDPTTETVPAGETQMWKITHNGVDAHPVHFHLLNVQLINRVGWDGTLKAPEHGELGWKETIKMNPLEDVIVAVRAKIPPLPGFGVPKSLRAMDPSQPIGGTTDFMNLDPYTGLAPAIRVSNTVQDFDWEYVWHCHILGHEENDFMRPMVYTGLSVAPTASSQSAIQAYSHGTAAYKVANPLLAGAPTSVSAVVSAAAPFSVTLSWIDNSSNEFRFDILRQPTTDALGVALAVLPAPAVIGSALANHVSFTDTTVSGGVTYKYTVRSVAAMGSADSTAVTVAIGAAAPAAPTALALTVPVWDAVTGSFGTTASWVDNSANELGFLLQDAASAGVMGTVPGLTLTATAPFYDLPANTTSNANTGLAQATTYGYQVAAVNASGTSAFSTASLTTPAAPALVPTMGAATGVTATAATINWTNGTVGKQTSITVGATSTTVGAVLPATQTLAAGATTASFTGLTQNASYVFTVTSINAPAGPAVVAATTAAASTTVAGNFAVVGAVGVTATALSPTAISLNLADAGPVTGYTIVRAAAGATPAATFYVAAAGAATAWTDPTVLAQATSYSYTVTPFNGPFTGGVAPVVNAVNGSNNGTAVTGSATTNYAASGSMLTLAGSATSSTQVTLTFSSGAPVTGYVVSRTGGAAFTPVWVAAPATQYVDNTAAAATTYTYSVAPWNASLAAGMPTTALVTLANGTTIAGGNAGTPVLSAPVSTSVVALLATVTTVSTASSITLTLGTTSGTATGYVVTYCVAGATAGSCAGTATTQTAVATAGAATVTFSGLPAGTAYTFTAAAIQGAVTGVPVVASASTLAGAAVAAPVGLAATMRAVTPLIQLTWTDPGTNITQYIIERSIDGVTYAQIGITTVGTVGSVRTFSDTSVILGNTYWYRVMAVNITGTVTSQSAYAYVGPEVFAATAIPAVPTAPVAVPGTTVGTVALSWPAVTGAATYQLYRNGGAQGAPVATPAAIGNVPNANTTYTFTVTAINAMGGASAQSAGTTVVTPAAPAAPTVAVVVGGGANLSWATAANATSYTVQSRNRTVGGAWVAQAASVTGTTASVTGLIVGNRYQFRIVSVSAVGITAAGGSSATVTAQ